jgi:hypothetical protein
MKARGNFATFQAVWNAKLAELEFRHSSGPQPSRCARLVVVWQGI